MAVTSVVMARSALTNASATYYTTGAAKTAIVTNIVLTNVSTTTDRTATILLNDVTLLSAVTVPASSVATFDLKQVLPANQTIKALASANTDVKMHVSGVEVS